MMVKKKDERMKVSKQSMKLQTFNEIVTVHLQVVREVGRFCDFSFPLVHMYTIEQR